MDSSYKKKSKTKDIQVTTNEGVHVYKKDNGAFFLSAAAPKKKQKPKPINVDDFVIVTKEEIEQLSAENAEERKKKLEIVDKRNPDSLAAPEQKEEEVPEEDLQEEDLQEEEKEEHELKESSVIDIKDTPQFKNMEFKEYDKVEEDIIKRQKKAKIDRKWNEPFYVGFDRKYSGEKNDDSARMALIKNRLYDYYETLDNKGDELKALNRIVKACDGYLLKRIRKVPMMLLMSWKFPKFCARWHEVRMLKKEAKKKIAELTKNNVNPSLIYENPGAMYVGNLGALVGGPIALVRFLVENPIRLVLKVLTVPVWAVNEGIREIVKWRGGIPPRHIKFPGLHWLREYIDRNDTWLTKNGTTKKVDPHAGMGQHWYDKFFVDYHTKDKDIIERAQLDMDMAQYDFDEDGPDAWEGFKKYAKPMSEKKKKKLEESLRDEGWIEQSGKAADNILTLDMNIANKELTKIKKELKAKEEKARQEEDKAQKDKAQKKADDDFAKGIEIIQTELAEQSRQFKEKKAGKQEALKNKKEEELKKNQEQSVIIVETEVKQEIKKEEKKEEKKKDKATEVKEKAEGVFAAGKKPKTLAELRALSKKDLERLDEIKRLRGSKAYLAERDKILPIIKKRAADSGLLDFVDDNIKAESLNIDDFTEEKKSQYEKILKDKGYQIGKTHAANVFYRKQLIQYSDIALDFVWKEGTEKVVKEAYDWLVKYYLVRDKSKKEKPAYGKKLDIPKYKIMLEDADQIHKEYETQPLYSNNCFACSGAELYRHYCRVNKRDDGKVDQFSIIDYKPDFKKYDDYKKIIAELDPETTPEVFEDYKGEVNSYLVGRDRHGSVGNVFEIGDFFIDKQKDAMLNRSVYIVPPYSDKWDKARKKQYEIDLHNRRVFFLNRVKEGLDAKSPVSLLIQNPKHYLTIIGIDGNKVKMVDSLKHNRGKILSKSIDELLPPSYDGTMVEIVWMSKVKPIEELKKNFRSLEYDSEKGFSNKDPLIDEITSVAQTKGVMATRYYQDMEYYVDGVRDCVYLPKHYKANGK